MTTASAIKLLPVNTLHFDKKNPRLAEYGISLKSIDEDIITVLWDAMDVRELVQSIAASGFFPHEPLIVTEEEGKYIVIEGNRRLAAVKVLLHETIAEGNGWDIPEISEEAKNELGELPVTFAQREESWRYLGFKHVNGPAKWSSYAKAKYIADVHKSYRIPLDDIANQIGDRHRTVQRLYRGLMVIEQAEREKVYHRDNRFRQRFAFSHLYTGLDYEGISTFISLKAEDEEAESPVPIDKIEQLGELCVWLYGSKSDKLPPVVESQNPHLRQLDAVLKSREAVAALRGGEGLESAYEISRPKAVIFEEALMEAKRELTRARAHLTEGYDKSEDLLRLAGTVAELADDLYSEMVRKRNPEKKRITEEK
ncbi:MAG: hypothetical protein EPN22_15150 [Nitrospirae bacterium]|nr:MAG: hypothetical protein EPN22_15150 [Nitrospirota bacterium]